jgi:type II secretory ATPase GspE/PulE/Tfp pilus assembly ATPase PilB-like protein
MAKETEAAADLSVASTSIPTSDAQGEVERLIKVDTSITQLVDYIIDHAYQARASDIHIDPQEKVVMVRLRIDGVMHHIFTLPKEILPQIITRIKVHCGLRTDEHQAAQDGRFRVGVDDHKIDLRVSIIPTYNGENAVLRLLVSEFRKLDLDQLGYSPEDLKVLRRYIKKSYGMILATGPTGSGKTTTLYSIIQELNTPEVTVTTIEDPIEYSMAGVSQIQVNPQTNLTFAKGLRSIVRQDPNIIMVGEIRDNETAGIAVNAALTGHMVLTTLHTIDAATTLPRLLDMGMEPFLVASTVNVAIGQRLVRKICPDCKVEYKLTDAERDRLRAVVSEPIFKKYEVFYVGRGCPQCNDSGYKGRAGIYEVLEVRGEVRDLVLKKASAEAVKQAAIKNGMTTMLEDGFRKAGMGITSIAEVLRVVQD